MKVGNLVMMPITQRFFDWTQFTVDIDGKQTHCVVNHALNFVVVHHSTLESRITTLDEYNNFEGDMTEFISQTFEDWELLAEFCFGEIQKELLEGLNRENEQQFIDLEQ